MTELPKRSLRTERVLMNANQEAARLHHEYVGTEHLLLALTADREGVAVAALRNLAIDLDRIRSTVEETVKRGTSTMSAEETRPITSRTKKSLDLAASVASEMGHTWLGTEHVLLGLLEESGSIAAQILAAAGVRVDATRAEIVRLLGPLPQG